MVALLVGNITAMSMKYELVLVYLRGLNICICRIEFMYMLRKSLILVYLQE